MRSSGVCVMSTGESQTYASPSSGLKYRAAKCVRDGTVTRVTVLKLLR